MPESRQQRRARERAERKRANRPGPMIVVGPEPEPSRDTPGHRAVRVVDVDIYRYLPDPDDRDDLDGWSAESGLRDEAVSYGHDLSEDLAELVAQVVEDNVTRWADRYDITFVWMLEGSAEAMHQAAAAVGVTLPEYPPGA